MRKLILLSVLLVGIISVAVHATSSKHQDAAVVGPGPDTISNKIAVDVGTEPDGINTNVIAHEEGPQPSIAKALNMNDFIFDNLFAADAGPGPTLIANHTV